MFRTAGAARASEVNLVHHVLGIRIYDWLRTKAGPRRTDLSNPRFNPRPPSKLTRTMTLQSSGFVSIEICSLPPSLCYRSWAVVDSMCAADRPQIPLGDTSPSQPRPGRSRLNLHHKPMHVPQRGRRRSLVGSANVNPAAELRTGEQTRVGWPRSP